MKVLKIWLRDGTLAYSTSKHSIGERFPSSQIDAAFMGRVSGSFDDLDDKENEFERELNLSLIEIYAPIYLINTRQIIAVGEIYNSGERLGAELRSIRFTSIGIVGAVTAPMMFVLFLMVSRASRAVAAHRKNLEKALIEARALAGQNDRLRQQADDARLESIQSNERLLDQIGQDLHDGPIQLLSIMKLKLSELFSTKSAPKILQEAQSRSNVPELLNNALADLRNISTGLVLPELDGLSAEETLRLAVRQHENATGTVVRCEIENLPKYASTATRICLYRIVQEALNNAFHYAGGSGQHVTASADMNWITVVVTDHGVDAAEQCRSPHREVGLGLIGLRRRVEIIRGTFEVSLLSDGTRVSAKIPITVELD
jgi:signal transduction histidine kinase